MTLQSSYHLAEYSPKKQYHSLLVEHVSDVILGLHFSDDQRKHYS